MKEFSISPPSLVPTNKSAMLGSSMPSSGWTVRHGVRELAYHTFAPPAPQDRVGVGSGKEFSIGPFMFTNEGAVLDASAPSNGWTMRYGARELAYRTLAASASQDEVGSIFADDRACFVREQCERYTPDVLDLVDYESGESVAKLAISSDPGLTPELIDNRSRYWLRSADRLWSLGVTLGQFAQIARTYGALENHWITGLLPDDVLTHDAEIWCAPTAWEIRHVVGESSFTGVSGAHAAVLVGVTPQNFRKYTASDNSATRQKISFAMWHLLLHKLKIQKA